MTDQPNSAADRAANASAPDGGTPAGDPELAALVRRDPPPDDADETPQASEAGPTTGDAQFIGADSEIPESFHSLSKSGNDSFNQGAGDIVAIGVGGIESMNHAAGVW